MTRFTFFLKPLCLLYLSVFLSFNVKSSHLSGNTALISDITNVTLTFTPDGGGTTVVAEAVDPDGTGPDPLAVTGNIQLLESTDYTLSIEIQSGNTNLTTEIQQNANDYLFFFGFTDEVFRSPAGDGNIDQRSDAVNYEDMDSNNLPLGLSTTWTVECGNEDITGTFRVLLKHQIDSKTATSTSEDGITDLDLTWDISVAQDPDAPPCENEEEIITDVILTFTPTAGGDAVVARAQDPDGEGPLDLEILDQIELIENTTYDLSVEFYNSIEDEDITEEVEEEADEHMIFFEWTEGLFSDPSGNGNADNRADPVNYNDQDVNGFPLGLATSWTTGGILSGTFRLVLKHQPGMKSANSTIDDGNSDIDLTWDLGTVTGIVSYRESKQVFKIWPNPVKDHLAWKIRSYQGEINGFVIYDQIGRVVSRISDVSPTLDMKHLPLGHYVIVGYGSNRRWIQRFMK